MAHTTRRGTPSTLTVVELSPGIEKKRVENAMIREKRKKKERK